MTLTLDIKKCPIDLENSQDGTIAVDVEGIFQDGFYVPKDLALMLCSVLPGFHEVVFVSSTIALATSARIAVPEFGSIEPYTHASKWLPEIVGINHLLASRGISVL